MAGARGLPEVRGFYARAVLLSAAQAAVVWLAGATWDPWLRAHRLVSADALGVAGGALAGYVALTFVYYWWHRARHAVPFLWRWFHQVHHSPARIEVLTSFYKHPFELFANGVLSSAVLYLAVGVGAEAAALAVLLSGLAELVYHWNVRTPRAMGFFFQRPEMHRVHHREGLHRYNYSDLPIWDLLFGTFSNPRTAEEPCGLGAGAEHRLGELLRGRDLTPGAPPAPARTAPRLAAAPFLAALGLGTGAEARIGDWVRDRALAPSRPLARARAVPGLAAAALLTALGLAQMAAAALDLPRVRAVAAATGASPAPKVFTAVRGLETFSSRYVVEVETATGATERFELTPERYAALAGPYARRNAYGAAVAYGPVLAADPRTAPLLASVLHYGLCEPAPLLRELGMAGERVRSGRIRVIPRDGSVPDAELPLVLEADCS